MRTPFNGLVPLWIHKELWQPGPRPRSGFPNDVPATGQIGLTFSRSVVCSPEALPGASVGGWIGGRRPT